jgi:LCP family protein required for cell wall assembly
VPSGRDGRVRGRASLPDARRETPLDARRPRRGGVYGGRPGGPRWGRITLVGLLSLLVLAGLGIGGGLLYVNHLNAGLQRDDPFSQITASRPAKQVAGALNILLLGSDSRDPDSKANGEWRTDTMIFLHVPSSHDHAYLISIPRDLYVSIPESPTNPEYGNTKGKINAAFSWGGLPLVVQTIEGYTGVRVDHVVLIDFGGFKQVTDALGGVDMNIEQDITSIHPPHRHFRAGVNHLNGTEALDYIRQRYQFTDGDFSRMRHQQQFLKALMDKAAGSGTLSNPARLNAFLKSVTAAMTVDKDFSLTDLGLQFRNIRGGDLTFMVNPNLGSQTINGESVVVSDRTRAGALYDAVTQDTVKDWMAQNVTPSTGASTSGG